MTHSSFATFVHDHVFLAPSVLIVSSAHYQEQLKGAILQILSENFRLRRLLIMKFIVTICSLTSLVATLVVITTSLPQSPSSPPNSIFSRGLPPPPPPPRRPGPPPVWVPRKDCPGLGASKYEVDFRHKLVKRNSESEEIHAGVLDPRYYPGPPCGLINGDVESNYFSFLNTGYFMLYWQFAGAVLANQFVIIMRVNNDRPDTAMKGTRAFTRIQYLHFFAYAGQRYYIRLVRQPVIMAWWFEDSTT